MDTSDILKDKTKAPVVDIQQELQATSFGKQRTQAITGIEPGKLLNLKIDQVLTYDKNPRREDNPEHEQIKSSIRQRGMDQVLSVTQRPDDAVNTFMIIHGGNTRLEILKELYEETKDPKFGTLQCRYVAWESESDAIIGHLIENDARGDYSFIDRAIGVRNTKKELEKETDKKLSDRGLISILHEQGYKLSRIDLFRMNYAVDVLYPAMPIAMEAGIGPRQIDSLRKLHKKTEDIYQNVQGTNDKKSENWKDLFHEILAKQNSENWSYDDIYSDALLQLANGDAAEANRLSFMLSSRLEGLDKETTKSNHPVESAIEHSEEGIVSGDSSVTDIEKTSIQTRETKPDTTESQPPNPVSITQGDQEESPKTEEFKSNSHQDIPSIQDSNTELVSELNNTSAKDLRSKLFTHALKLASNNGYGELIAPLPSLGAGFIIKDLPSESFMKGEALFGTIKKRPYKERIMVWWMLFGFSQLRVMSSNKPALIEPLLPEGDLKTVLFNVDASSGDQRRLALGHIFQRTGEFIIDDLSVFFWAVASEKNIADIQAMQVTYRQLNEVLDFDLWEEK